MTVTKNSFSDFVTLVQDVWQNGLYGINIGQIIIAFLIIVTAYFIRNIFTRIVFRRLQRIAKRTKNTLDDSILDAIEDPIRFIPVVIGIFLATTIPNLDEGATLFFTNLNRSLIAYTIFWALYRASTPVSEILRQADRFLTESMILWLAKAIKASFAILGAATILEIWGIQVGPLIAGLGLFGVAVALGAQDLFKNLIAGLFVIGERRFQPGDWIMVKGIVEGTVEHIGFRTTTIRRFDKAPVYVPNSSLSDTAVTNFSRMTYRRIKWVIGLKYDSTQAQLKAVREGIEAYLAHEQDYVRPEDTTTFVRIDQFSASSIDLLLYCFTNTTNWLEWLEIKERLLLEIKRLVEDAGTGFAFPSRSLYIESMGEDIEAPIMPPRKD